MIRKKSTESFEHATSLFTLTCKKCGTKRIHEVTYVNVIVQHLQCRTCRTVRVYLIADRIGEGEFNAAALDLEALQKQPGQKDPYPYRPGDRFVDGEFLNHQTFGEGYVLAVYHPPVKMAVLFADKCRLLVCGTCSNTEYGCTGFVTGETQLAVAAAPVDSASGKEEPCESSESVTATCPKCGRTVHPYNLSRTVDGRATTGCTFCVMQ